MSDKTEVEEINELVASATEKIMMQRTLLMQEAVIGCFLDYKTPAETAAILREIADQLEMYL